MSIQTAIKELERQSAQDHMMYASTHSARKMLIAIADDFQNDYLTVPRYAECNGLTIAQAYNLIELAQAIRAADHPES